ncbi:MAG: hypothetical protein WAO56_04360 [Miniphocaeibacter sp.]|uniref:TcaA 3rd/4th domain-containing protein n=1 Tax=Miniphocaeibacter sp. TaxID=3100973 RepID=UPI003BB18F9B
MSNDDNNKKIDIKGYFHRLMDKLDFHKVEDEEINIKEIIKKEKDKKVKDEKLVKLKDKNNPLSGRKILIENSNNLEKDKEVNKINSNLETSPKDGKLKFLLIFVTIICLAIIAFLLFINFKVTDIDKIEGEYISAIEDHNINKLEKLTYIEGDKKEYYKESFNNFIDLYENDKDFADYVKNSISSDIKNIKENENYSTENLIGVVKSNRGNLFSKDYKIKITPINIKDESIVKKEVEIGKLYKTKDLTLLPGIYKIKSEFEFLKLSDVVKIKYENKENNFNILMDFKNSKLANENFKIIEGDFELVIDSVDEDAIVFVNGKNTNMTVEEFNEFGNKNLSKQDSIAVVEKSKFGYALSNSVSLENVDDYVDLEMNYENNFYLDHFINIIKKTLKENEMAFENSDINLFSTIGGEALDTAIGWIKSNIGYNQYYVRNYMSYLIDLSSFEVNISDFNETAYIGGFLSYKEGRFSKDEEVNKDKLEDNIDKKVGFHFKFNDDTESWYVDLWGSTYRNIETNNTILLKLD